MGNGQGSMGTGQSAGHPVKDKLLSVLGTLLQEHKQQLGAKTCMPMKRQASVYQTALL